MMLDIHLHYEDDTKQSFVALNDVLVTKNDFKITDFNVKVGDITVGDYRADGVLFATPTGSTAHALSAGGPIIEPTLECIEMNLICPHSLANRPVLFSPERTLLLRHANDDVYISVDGEEPIPFPKTAHLELSHSAHYINIVDVNREYFHSALSRKMSPVG
jgi:NAD+ kinase